MPEVELSFLLSGAKEFDLDLLIIYFKKLNYNSGSKLNYGTETLRITKHGQIDIARVNNIVRGMHVKHIEKRLDACVYYTKSRVHSYLYMRAYTHTYYKQY
jgi:hypothetical protein